jgi:hypothetical protein
MSIANTLYGHGVFTRHGQNNSMSIANTIYGHSIVSDSERANEVRSTMSATKQYGVGTRHEYVSATNI